VGVGEEEEEEKEEEGEDGPTSMSSSACAELSVQCPKKRPKSFRRARLLGKNQQ
jgi:hypothetical protein